MTISTSLHIPLSELSRRATVDKTGLSKYSVKRWISTVGKLFDEGDFEYRKHSIQNAYVHYMKGCSIMLEVIATHPNFKEARNDPSYKLLKSRMSDIVVNLEDITLELQQQDVANHRDDVLEEAMTKYPSLDEFDSRENQTQSDYLLDDLPSVPTHAPLKTKRPSAPQPDIQPVYMKMPEPHPSPPPIPPTSHNSVSSTDSTLILPSPTNFIFPSVLIVDPPQLANWIKKTGSENPPSILILDVRPRYISEQGCIKHRWIAQIEPLVLKQDVHSQKIEESMVMNRNPEQFVFSNRQQFDLIVYYDQNSISAANSVPLRNLHSAIYEMEFQKTLSRTPMMLAGGFDAWRSTVGEKGIYRYDRGSSDDNSPSFPQPKPHWLQDVVRHGSDQSVTLEPVQVHRTTYDYFNSSGTSGNKESMSRHTNKYKDTPPLRGIFNNSLNQPYPYSPTFSMPIPQPTGSNTPDIETFSTKYPDIQPNTSSKPGITRKNTYIDNPFNGFTKTTNKQFDVPPLPPKHVRPSPTDSSPPLPPKPSNIYDVHTSSPPTENRFAPVSGNSFSQIGTVMNGTTGLKNLGNTCFMNSIIQCLSGTVPFARYFLSGSYRKHINKENVLGTGGVVAEEFTALLRTMWGAQYNFVSPILFREALIKFAPQFKGSEQHDSQEFLNFLLDGIHEDCNLITKRPVPPPESAEEEARFEKLPDWKASGIAWERYLERNSSVVVSLFQGQYRSRLTCLTCYATSTTYNSFMSLSLPIPKNNGASGVSLYDCLDYFVREEVLEKDDAWNCPKCKTLRKASKSLTLSKLPDVLLIHLKRFSYDGPFKNKLEIVVDSPMTGLDLSRYVPSSMFPPDTIVEQSTFNYDLYAVSNHFGSLTGGHYTACVRNGYKNEWHNFDDSRFSVCDQSKVLSRAAYNLFYVRSTVK
ncbi:hypothetical protein INT47_001639 [Mucor saturninus]|uniref:Ubiquitin carboxyl-terminal hydrolase n=1 Tax=Mucor saturninus TaxID=64648 RepID=A0A8H7RKW9_9FUNG|nr:hypothetical protein INT47_001639 [Mucor saturninus]